MRSTPRCVNKPIDLSASMLLGKPFGVVSIKIERKEGNLLINKGAGNGYIVTSDSRGCLQCCSTNSATGTPSTQKPKSPSTC